MPIVEEVIQGSPEWVVMRVGLVTASRMADLMAKRKDMAESDKRYGYKLELVTEILTGRAADHYVSPEMQWGIETQAEAAAAYEHKHDLLLDEGGFWINDSINRFAASPDYLVGKDGLLECKCPKTATHLKWKLAGKVPDEHKWQMLAQLACTGRKWVDFMSFDPRLPKDLRAFIVRMERDEGLIRGMETDVTQFLAEVDALLNKIRG